LKSHNDEMKYLLESNSSLTKNSENNDQYNSLLQENDSLKMELNYLKENMDNNVNSSKLVEQNQGLQERISTLETQNRCLKLERDNFKDQLEKLDVTYKQTSESIKKLNEQYIGFNNSGINELVTEFKSKMIEIEERNNSNVEYLKNQISELQNQVNILTTDNEKLLSSLLDVNGENSNYVLQIEKLTDEKNNLLDRPNFENVSDLRINHNVTGNTIDTLLQEKNNMQEELQILYTMREELQEDNRMLRLKLNSNNNESINLRSFIDLYPELEEELANVEDNETKVDILHKVVTRQPVVYFSNFSQGKNVILKPTDYDRRVYELISLDGKKYFLHMDLYAQFKQDIDGGKWIIGQIVFIDREIIRDYRNPYRLPSGTEINLAFITKNINS